MILFFLENMHEKPLRFGHMHEKQKIFYFF
jgi:hypothetical protein